ncbi:MAG: class I SAM-dependent methyltransferase [Proteobacteria bacterium]|nr:class I SAM-dependent methyltransferase [Pseudomonadota bacterium]
MIDHQESITAKLCSFVRAHHSTFDRTKIFDDYLAYDLMGEEEYTHVCDMLRNGLCAQCPAAASHDPDAIQNGVCFLAPIPLSREAYTKHIFEDFLKAHSHCQYIICGAGMDTFSFRNDNDNITIFEIDHPDTQKYKKTRLETLGWIIRRNIHFVAVDFAKDDLSQKLLDAGLDPNIPTFISILGVTYYLTLETLEDTIRKLDDITAKQSKIILDFPDKTTFSHHSERARKLAEMTRQLGENMTHGFSTYELAKMFMRNHFTVTDHQTPNQIQKLYFDGRKDGLRAYENIHFLTAEKTEHFISPTYTYHI